jgi:TolB-like protein
MLPVSVSLSRWNQSYPPLQRSFLKVVGTSMLVLFLLWASPAVGQPSVFRDAEEALTYGDYEKAISLFSQVAQDTSVRKDVRRESLRHLGRAHIAKDQREKAREALKELVMLEPPVVELDPDRQPPPLMDLYYEVRREVDGSYAIKKDDPGLQTLAIMDFTNSSVDQNERFEPLSKGFPSMMINTMSGATSLKVVERERIQWLLKEIKLQQQANIVDQSTAVRAGELLGVNTVLFGSYIVHNEEMWLSARLVKVETGEILLSDKITGEPDRFFELIDDLSKQITRSINVEMEEARSKSMGATTESLDAMLAYSDGLDELEDGDYRAAREKFMLALEYDPDYTQARLKAQSIKPMLADSDGRNNQ